MSKRVEAPEETPEETLESVEQHTPAFAMVPEWAVFSSRLTNNQFRVYTFLCLYANKYDRAWPKVETLALKAGITHQAISKTIRELKALGLVTITKYGFPARNRYFVHRGPHPPADWLDDQEGDQLQPDVDPDDTDASCNPTLHQLQPVVASVATPRLQQQHTNRTDHKNISSEDSSLSFSLAQSAEIGAIKGSHHETPSAKGAAPPERRTRERELKTALERDPLFSALEGALACRPVTRHEWGQWAKCVNDLREINATPAQVRAVVHAFRATHPQARCTVFAVLNNWGALSQKASNAHGSPAIKTAEEMDAERAAAQAEHERRMRDWAEFEAEVVASGLVGPPVRQ